MSLRLGLLKCPSPIKAVYSDQERSNESKTRNTGDNVYLLFLWVLRYANYLECDVPGLQKEKYTAVATNLQTSSENKEEKLIRGFDVLPNKGKPFE